MVCAACGEGLVEGARFCAACGTPVRRACPACGAELPGEARFCPSCGAAVTEPLVAASSAGALGRPGGVDPEHRERKVATLLFADLVGFTSMGEAHDPELVGGIVRRVFERLGREVERYEGTIEKFAGDAMLAAFGVPVAHEDDPERAVRSALEMQAAIAALDEELRADGRPRLQLRIGIETGEVLVDVARAATSRDLFVAGDAVNTAARLEQSAEPGAIVVGPGTYAATRADVEYDERPPIALKGKALPLVAWQVVQVRSRRGGARARLGMEAPLIGRDAETGLLKEAVRRVVAEGRPQLVTVLGAPGVGKSRLTWELEKYLDGLPETFHWRKGRSMAYAQASYSALVEVIRTDAAIREDDAPDAALERLAARHDELGGTDPELRALEALLALGDPSGMSRDTLFDAWRSTLERIARRAPLVLALEDVHWADDGLLDFIGYVARWADAPILVLCLARHELLEKRPAWGGGIPDATAIALRPLGDDEARRLVAGLVGSALPEALVTRIVGLAEGNPLFAEELVRMLVDRGVLRQAQGIWEVVGALDDVEIPGTVQSVLTARLDALPPAEKRLAQRAAVVGRVFWDAVVAHLSHEPVNTTDDQLRRLRVKELVVRREPSTLAGALEFGFRHVLIRDVAYESLAKRDRAALHLAVARWAETELADRVDELIELIASHRLAALRYEEAFAAPHDPTLRAIREATYRSAARAGDRALAVHQIDVAARWLELAIEVGGILGVDPRERGRLAERYATGTRGGVRPSRVLEVLESVMPDLRAIHDPSDEDRELLAQVRAARANMLALDNRIPEARLELREVVDDVPAGVPSVARARAYGALGATYWRAGPVDEAMPVLLAAIDEARLVGDGNVERTALQDLGNAYGVQGEIGLALEYLRESLRQARDAGDEGLRALGANNLGSQMVENGDDVEAIEAVLREGIAVATRSARLRVVSVTEVTLGDLYFFRGLLREAQEHQTLAREAAIALRNELEVDVADIGIGWCRFARGDDSMVAAVDAAHARYLAGGPDTQGDAWMAMWDAWVLARTDLEAAVRSMTAQDWDGASAHPRRELGRFLARAALRVGDEVSLDAGVRMAVDVARRCTGRIRVLEVDWLGALGRREAATPAALASIADEFEALGWPWMAADCLADAALIAARADLDADPFRGKAQALYDAQGIRPMLGPLPERRWIGSAASRAGTAAPSD